MQKPIGAPMMVFFLAGTSLLTAALYGFRLLPSLHAATMIANGTIYPTAWWVHRFALTNVLMSVPFLVAGIVGLLTLNESRRRYVASLPRWQQWFIWPFHGVATSGAGPRYSAVNTASKEPKLLLTVAIYRYWHHLIGIAVFPLVAHLGFSYLHLPPLLFLLLFAAAVIYAEWPCWTERVPSTYQFVPFLAGVSGCLAVVAGLRFVSLVQWLLSSHRS